MFFNLLSTSIGYRGVAAVALAAGLVATIGWLRRLPPRAPLTQAGIPILLSLALVATIAALVPAWSTPATIVAAVPLLTAAALTATLERAADLFASIASIGGGLALIGLGAGLLLHNATLGSAASIGGGLASIGLGAGLLLHNATLGSAASIGGGLASIGLGAGLLLHNHTLVSAASIGGGLIGGGLASIGYGLYQLRLTGATTRLWTRMIALTREADSNSTIAKNPASEKVKSGGTDPDRLVPPDLASRRSEEVPTDTSTRN